MVLETNIHYDKNYNIQDHESRLIQMSTWKDYIDIYNNYNKTASGNNFATNILGDILPDDCKIINLKYDKYHLNCEIVLSNGIKETRLASWLRFGDFW